MACSAPKCTATLRYTGAPGWYTLHVQYFDQNNGVSHFALRVGSQTIDEWTAADHVPSARIDSSTSARRVIRGVALRPGDEIHIEGAPDAGEPAPLDYMEIVPDVNPPVRTAASSASAGRAAASSAGRGAPLHPPTALAAKP